MGILEAGIGVMTAVNIQHLETLNDAVGRGNRRTGARDGPRHLPRSGGRGGQRGRDGRGASLAPAPGKDLRPEKVEQALTNFFSEGDLSTLRELALRATADEVGEKAASYRQREGLEPALIPERVMVCMSQAPTHPVSFAWEHASPGGWALFGTQST